MRAVLTTALEVLGMAVVAAGCWLFSPILGLIAAGSALILVGWLLG